MTVTSTSADGWVSQNSFWNYQVDTSPTVSSDVYLENQTSGGAGVPGTFTFAPKVKGITSYTYAFSDGTGGTVAAHKVTGPPRSPRRPPRVASTSSMSTAPRRTGCS